MAINATNSSCMQTIYDFHNRGVGYLGNSDSCISKILTIDPNDCIGVRVARLALIFFTGIVHVLGRLFGWCSGDAATYQPETTVLNTSTPASRSTVEGTANATNQSSSQVLGTATPEPLDQTFNGETPLEGALSGENVQEEEHLPPLSPIEDLAGAPTQTNLGKQESEDLGFHLDVSPTSSTPSSPTGSQSPVQQKQQAQTPDTLSPTGSSILTSPEIGSFVPITGEFVPDLTGSPQKGLPPLTLGETSDVGSSVIIAESETITITHADGTTTESSMTETAAPGTDTIAPRIDLTEGGDTTKAGKSPEMTVSESAAASTPHITSKEGTAPRRDVGFWEDPFRWAKGETVLMTPSEVARKERLEALKLAEKEEAARRKTLKELKGGRVR